MHSDGQHQLNSDLHPPLTPHEARVESDRCYFCYDAPCVTACPTGIDIPVFIRQISTGNVKGAAKTIFDENIFGGMCARVCPTETLCQEGCVRHAAEDKPVRIGLLQRYATDEMMATGKQPYNRKKLLPTRIAVIGAGPAGLACAHRLALHGHTIDVFDARSRGGGLNEYGIAAYKTIDNFAQRELEYIVSIGGIKISHEKTLGVDFTLDSLKADYAAVFLGVGLGKVNDLSIDGDSATGVDDAVDFIARLRQSSNVADVSVGRRIVVIGGGMTAIDAAVQARMLGAEDVTVVYRRAQQLMNASAYEQHLAQTSGVLLKTGLQPRHINIEQGKVTGVEFEYTVDVGGQLKGSGDTLTIPCDQVLKAIGQAFDKNLGTSLELTGGRIEIDGDGRTSDDKIWAGGDCAAGVDDLTVAAVQDGKMAAESIHRSLTQ